MTAEKGRTGIRDIYGEYVFDEKTMKERLPEDVFEKWKECVADQRTLEMEEASVIAEAMKKWAEELGATHFTHWFQPMTGATAEKHDSFLETQSDGSVITKFSGKELIKGEPDASSFPSGGLRSTFEARGYTAWDPTSPAFVKEDSLYIPTIFCSYSGQALDKKMPLLQSMTDVSRAAVRILRLFGDTDTNRVMAEVGPEQEYFLIDKKMYNAREDLRLAGRTLFGSMSPRGQEMDDHYFGMIKPRVAEFMEDLDHELWKLGVPSKTKHNEVAPSQHEMAAIYSDANTACDHNQLAMELMKKVADRHGFACLLHEKPFDGVNGSGKHDNWSLSTDSGENLFKPGSTPSQNKRFLLFLAAFVAGVDEYQGLLRASVASAGNDHRLGGQEAPPAVISIFLGDELTDVIDSIINETAHHDTGKKILDIGLDALPEIRQDNTDRNRTSPMAFTGNKFEFRMLGSSESISGPNIILNIMMAEELDRYADELEKADDFDAALQELLKREFSQHKRIIFNGDGYTEEWEAEAVKRGLLDMKTMPEAMKAFDDQKNCDLFIKHGIYTQEELDARNRVYIEKYSQVITIEAKTMSDMIWKDILPAVSKYESELCSRVQEKKDAGIPSEYETDLCRENASLTDELYAAVKKLDKDLGETPEGAKEAMNHCCYVVLPDMRAARSAADKLEKITDRSYWPFPTYDQLLFSEK